MNKHDEAAASKSMHIDWYQKIFFFLSYLKLCWGWGLTGKIFDVCAHEWFEVSFDYVCIRKQKQIDRVNEVGVEDAESTLYMFSE